VMWSHLLTDAIPARPLVLIGPGWKATFETFISSLGEYVSEPERQWLSFCSSVDEVPAYLDTFRPIS
jgi:hypothetical protein